jgi:Transposase IS116/IS110/IS902 family
VDASSGKQIRHRLNRGGDRQANHALWRIVISHMSAHPQTRAYVARRTAGGLSKEEIIRCLITSPARSTRSSAALNSQTECQRHNPSKIFRPTS